MPQSPLNRQPLGLLNFLGIKDGGWGPRMMSDILVPQFDLWRHYVNANGQDFDGVIPAQTAVGAFDVPITFQFNWPPALPSVVPQNEIWYLDYATIFATLTPGAGSQIRSLGLCFNDPTNGRLNMLPMSPIPVITSDAGVGVSVMSSMLYPCWAAPGLTCQFLGSFLSAATESFNARVTGRLVRLLI